MLDDCSLQHFCKICVTPRENSFFVSEITSISGWPETRGSVIWAGSQHEVSQPWPKRCLGIGRHCSMMGTVCHVPGTSGSISISGTLSSFHSSSAGRYYCPILRRNLRSWETELLVKYSKTPKVKSQSYLWFYLFKSYLWFITSLMCRDLSLFQMMASELAPGRQIQKTGAGSRRCRRQEREKGWRGPELRHVGCWLCGVCQASLKV